VHGRHRFGSGIIANEKVRATAFYSLKDDGLKNPWFACRMGSCGECEVKFAGKVAENGEFELAGKCKENGLAYACCSVALSDLEVEA
jgi:ferredoxin